MFIRYFQSKPDSALFESIERAEAPPMDVENLPDSLKGLSPYQWMQMRRWSSTDEGLHQIRAALFTTAGADVPLPRPWEVADDAVTADEVDTQRRAYHSAENTAARAAVVAPRQSEHTPGG